MTPSDWTFWIILGPFIGLIWLVFLAVFVAMICIVWIEFSNR